MFYTVKVKVYFETESGVKPKIEMYLIDAESVTDVEAKVTSDFQGYAGEFEVVGVDKSKIVKVIS